MPEPRVAVVIPIFRQPSLAAEVIESALRQETSFDYRIVAVNDGCPFAETHRVCRAYARAYPDKLLYIRQKNRGPGAARNMGIEVALRAWPSIEAIQLLNAAGPWKGERLGPRMLEKGYQALRARPELGWVYPNVHRFHCAHDHADLSGPWSVLEMLAGNYLPYACLFRREVFERGIRFDEQERTGCEDWDLWLQCIGQGLRGVYVPDLGFRSCQCPGSKAPRAPEDAASERSYVRARHPDLYHPRRVLELEQEECPRFALYLTDVRQVVLTSDPCLRECWFPVEDLVGHLVRAEQTPQAERFPGLLAVTSRAFLEAAAAGRFAPGLFWLLALRLGQGAAPLATAALTARLAGEVCLEFQRDAAAQATAPAEAALILLSTQTFQEALFVAGGGRLGAVLASRAPDATAIQVRCSQPTPVPPFPADAWEALRGLIDELGPSYRTCPRPTPPYPPQFLGGGGRDRRTSFRLAGEPPQSLREPPDLTCRVTQAGPPYPRLLDRSRTHLAYLLPVCDFGGAERVAANLAREARRRGWVPHLFVTGAATVRLLAEFRDVFETITPLDNPTLSCPDHLLGLLGGMDVVINTHCPRALEAFNALRREGVRTFCHLHSVPLTRSTGAPSGPPFDAVRFEHSIDGVLAGSRKMRDWCQAMGIPTEKVHYIPNAPSFEVSEALVNAALIERAERPAGSPLRVLFTGRFDGEKGLDRLVPLVQQSQERNLPFHWRIVGRAVLGDGPSEKELQPLRPYLQPPVQTLQALTRNYRWADVLILLSRYEGVPLTIIEGQSFGCVALATAVGGVDEVVEHGRTGFLLAPDLDLPALIASAIQHLSELQEDRGRLLRMAREAAAVRRAATWSRSFEPFARAVERLLAGRGGRQA